MDVRTDSSLDPFCFDTTDPSTSLQDAPESEAERILQNITALALSQLDHQHRVFMFSLVVFGTYARFIRWDRAGAIFTEAFDYREEPRQLAEFLWRYGRLSRAERGFDYTVRVATATEKHGLASAVEEYLSDNTNRAVAGMDRVVDADFPCYALSILDSTTRLNHTLIIQRPITTPSSPVGRATRAYIALDTSTNDLVFVKDYWRPVDPGRIAETQIYEALREAKVPHLPTIRMGGDVPEDVPGSQSTWSQKWVRRSGEKPAHTLREYRHHRIVQNLAFSLTTAKCSREIVAAIRNAISCTCHLSFISSHTDSVPLGIVSAYEAGWMHRDISSGNVMFDERGEGILNDWDHAVKVDPKSETTGARTVCAISMKFSRRLMSSL